MLYHNRAVRIGPGLAVGFGADGQPAVESVPESDGGPSPQAVFQAVGARREALLREVALLTAFLEAATAPAQSSGLVVVPGGAMPGPGRSRLM